MNIPDFTLAVREFISQHGRYLPNIVEMNSMDYRELDIMLSAHEEKNPLSPLTPPKAVDNLVRTIRIDGILLYVKPNGQINPGEIALSMTIRERYRVDKT